MFVPEPLHHDPPFVLFRAAYEVGGLHVRAEADVGQDAELLRRTRELAEMHTWLISNWVHS